MATSQKRKHFRPFEYSVFPELPGTSRPTSSTCQETISVMQFSSVLKQKGKVDTNANPDVLQNQASFEVERRNRESFSFVSGYGNKPVREIKNITPEPLKKQTEKQNCLQKQKAENVGEETTIDLNRKCLNTNIGTPEPKERLKTPQKKNESEDVDTNSVKEKPSGTENEAKIRGRNTLKKERNRRIREEEARRKMIAPKGQRVRVVNQKFLESLFGNNVSYVNKQAAFPVLNETDFPTVEESRKQKAKSIEIPQEEITKGVQILRIRKHKDPVQIDLVKLINTKPKIHPRRRTQKKDQSMPRYSGNPLDASNPERRRGKIKERPKKKKPTSLKSAILEERALRKRLKIITNTIQQGIAYSSTVQQDIASSSIVEQDITCSNPVQQGIISTSTVKCNNDDKTITRSIYSRKFREYCNNCVTKRLNEAVKLLLKDLVKFQDRQHQRDPVKAFAKRRYVAGFREVNKHLMLKKLKLIVIAPDLEVAKNKGGIDETVEELKTAAGDQEVLYLFALSRKELGYLTFKKVGISCIGICNYEGSEQNYEEVLDAVSEARASYDTLVSPSNCQSTMSDPDDETGKVIASLLSKLSVSESSESPFLTAIEHKSTPESDSE